MTDELLVDVVPAPGPEKAKPQLSLEPYARFEGGAIVELSCRMCRTLIGKLVPHEQQRITRKGTQTFITERMVFQHLPNYREFELFMDDGSRHVTNACADCAPLLTADPDLADQAHAVDVAQWASEGAVVARKTVERRVASAGRISAFISD